MHASQERLEEKYIVPIVREICKGIVKIHEAQIIHRDIKGQRLLSQSANWTNLYSGKRHDHRDRQCSDHRLWRGS